MTDALGGTPIEVAGLKGVLTTPPPPEFAGSITKTVEAFAAATLAPDQRGGFVGVAHKKGDQIQVNLAIVQRVGEHGAVVGWVAKDWGEPIGVGGGWTLRW